jgi:steroid delta-isomerase
MVATEEHAARYAQFFAKLSPNGLDDIAAWFAPDARLKDPFNDVRGPEAIRAVLAHMFDVTHEPRFEILESACHGRTAMYYWRFRFARDEARRHVHDIEGMSRVEFDGRGRVLSHVDYWDPAEGLYEKLPILGALCRYIRRRISAG